MCTKWQTLSFPSPSSCSFSFRQESLYCSGCINVHNIGMYILQLLASASEKTRTFLLNRENVSLTQCKLAWVGFLGVEIGNENPKPCMNQGLPQLHDSSQFRFRVWISGLVLEPSLGLGWSLASGMLWFSKEKEFPSSYFYLFTWTWPMHISVIECDPCSQFDQFLKTQFDPIFDISLRNIDYRAQLMCRNRELCTKNCAHESRMFDIL